ncbi:hypothetical protein JGI2_00607 [Candidatus Kryptobacter tengchongensis]|nr:hypothetical protein JGI2_00607 [Candidatus Kryptobacter tengchongensis]
MSRVCSAYIPRSSWIIKEKLLKEDGKKVLNEIFNLKREKNFLIAIEGTENYYLNKQLLELKRSNIAIVDIFFPYFNKVLGFYQGGSL